VGPSADGGLLLAESPSDVCLVCHAQRLGSVLGTDPLVPPPETGPGNFVFLTEDNLNDAPGGVTGPIRGDAAGHNLVAPGHALRADPRHASAPPVQLNLVERLARLREAPFFSGSSLGVIAELVRKETLQHFAEGESIWQEQDSADQMAIVLDGRFRSKGPFGECEVGPGAQMGAWDVLGEGQHVEGWIAVCPSRTLSISKNLLIDLLEDHFEFAESYLKNASSYLLACWNA
jgi:hypothetical protein